MLPTTHSAGPSAGQGAPRRDLDGVRLRPDREGRTSSGIGAVDCRSPVRARVRPGDGALSAGDQRGEGAEVASPAPREYLANRRIIHASPKPGRSSTPANAALGWFVGQPASRRDRGTRTVSRPRPQGNRPWWSAKVHKRDPRPPQRERTRLAVRLHAACGVPASPPTAIVPDRMGRTLAHSSDTRRPIS